MNKVASRLVNGETSSEASLLSKFKILKNGIAEKFIPRLSEHCKKEIEGSFKITKDEELRQSALAPSNNVELSDNDNLLIKIMNNNGEDVQKLIGMLKDSEFVDSREQGDQQVEDLVRKTFTTMICFQNLFDDVNQAMRSDEIDEVPSSIKDAWSKATKMRSWEHKTFNDPPNLANACGLIDKNAEVLYRLLTYSTNFQFPILYIFSRYSNASTGK